MAEGAEGVALASVLCNRGLCYQKMDLHRKALKASLLSQYYVTTCCCPVIEKLLRQRKSILAINCMSVTLLGSFSSV